MADIMGPRVEPKGVLVADLQERRWRRHPRRNHHTTTTSSTDTHAPADDFTASNGGAILDAATTKSLCLNNNNDQDIYAREKVEWSVSTENPEAVLVEDLDVIVVDADIAKVLNAFIINARDDEVESTHDHSNRSTEEREHEEITDCITDEYDDEEEVVELEFERAIKKLDKHTMHCPKCNTHLTKVILRRKRKLIAPKQPAPKALNLLGCLPCLSVFIPNGNSFNMFGVFGSQTKKPHQTPDQLEEAISSDNGNVLIREKVGCFGLFWIFPTKIDNESTEILDQKTTAVDIKSDSPSDPTDVNGVEVIEQVEDQEQHLKGKVVAATGKSYYYPYAQLRKYFGFHSPPQEAILQPGEVRLDIRDDPDHTLETKLLAGQHSETEEQQSATAEKLEENLTKDHQHAKPVEILKSIVYGGILECIKSLSLVAAAAASGATPLNIVVLTLANLIGGLFIIGHNLWFLRNDGSDSEASRYRQLLGQRENFPLHATFAVLSFLIFGLIPPLTYGFLSDYNLEFKMLAVGATSLFCVIMLAISKAYAHKALTFLSYIETIMYYVTVGFMSSTVCFVVGLLVKKFIEDFGSYDAISSPTVPATTSVNQILASY